MEAPDSYLFRTPPCCTEWKGVKDTEAALSRFVVTFAAFRCCGFLLLVVGFAIVEINGVMSTFLILLAGALRGTWKVGSRFSMVPTCVQDSRRR